MPYSRTRWVAAALPAAASLLLAAGAAPAFATDGTSSPVLRQELPRTATDKGAPQKDFGNCADIPANKDGWHFVLPGGGKNPATFVKLTVTFEKGGEQVLTSFGPPKDDHAYVASEAGDTLVSVVAEIEGTVPQDMFNLSHTCPADITTPGGPGGGDDNSGDDGGDGGDSGDGGNGGNGGDNSGDGGDKPGENEGTTPSEPTETGGESAGATEPAASESPAGDVSGDLAETGNGAPIGVLAAAAAALVAGGGYLMARRRTARQH